MLGWTALIIWALMHLLHAGRFIVHDAWSHLFPFVYGVSKDVSCGHDLPRWLSHVDSGSPLVINVISSSLTFPPRLLGLQLMSCLNLGVVPALYLQKLLIFGTYAAFSGSMLVLGWTLFRSRLTAVYLFAATLFAGLCLQVSHSDQAVSMVFWVPWMVICGAKFHAAETPAAAAWWLNGMALFAGVQMLDQYPHFIVFAGLVGVLLYVAFNARSSLLFLGKHGWRLWPAVVIFAVVGAQLLTVQAGIAAFVPSFRADVVVDPATFGETGFVQPTAFAGSFFPLGYLSAFEGLAHATGVWWSQHGGQAGERLFIFRLDQVLLSLGTVPLLLLVAGVVRASTRRPAAAWLAFAVMMLAVSVQQTRLYFLVFKLPFFDVFRSYFLYAIFVVFAALVISAYGFDALLSLSAAARRALVLRIASLLAMGSALGAGLAVWLGASIGAAGSVLRPQDVAFGLLDLAVFLLSITILYLAAGAQRRTIWAAAVVGATVLGQVVYTMGAYGLLGTSVDAMLGRFGIDPGTPRPGLATAVNFTRTACPINFAECYLSSHDTASLRTDLEGTFLRSRDTALLQPGLAPAAAQGLLGLTHPVFWISASVAPIGSADELVRDFNDHAANVGQYLGQVTHVPRRDMGKLPTGGSPASEARLTSLQRGPDEFRLGYQTNGQAYLNAAVTFDPSWQATANGQPLPIVRGNFDGLLVPLSPGSGTVTLHYHSTRADLFFFSRYALLLLAMALLVVGWRWRWFASSDTAPHATA